MSDAVVLDLLIQDFIRTNKISGTHYDWASLVNRRFLDDGLMKVFSFQSNGPCTAIGRHMVLPEADWFRIDLTHCIPDVEEHRFDCLRMMQAATHTGLDVEKIDRSTVLIKLTTKHRGLVNVAFLIRDNIPLDNPFLA